jgi:AcrR family transcriptional regulator
MAPRKANQPTLTRDQIVAAAIAIVDRDGLETLSMRRLASELGMSPMSLYYHVPDKSSLYDLILEAVMTEIDLSIDDPGKPAVERIVTAAYALRDALLAHPNAVPIALSRSMRTPGQIRPVDAMLGILFEAGVSPTDAVAAVDIIGMYVFGTTAARANHMADGEYHDAMRDSDFSAVTPEEFPNMARVVAESEYLGFDREFDLGLRILANGLVGPHD